MSHTPHYNNIKSQNHQAHGYRIQPTIIERSKGHLIAFINFPLFNRTVRLAAGRSHVLLQEATRMDA